MSPEPSAESPVGAVRLFPGFPLPATDYSGMLALLEADRGPDRPVVVAHSRGALDALASDASEGVPLVLLAPSSPRRRRGTSLLRVSLLLTGRVPLLRGAVARRLRDETYRRYDAEPPADSPLDLVTAARRLRSAPAALVHRDLRRVVVIISDDDPRSADQLLLAQQLSASVLRSPGGHLFPITHAASTASLILSAL